MCYSSKIFAYHETSVQIFVLMQHVFNVIIAYMICLKVRSVSLEKKFHDAVILLKGEGFM